MLGNHAAAPPTAAASILAELAIADGCRIVEPRLVPEFAYAPFRAMTSRQRYTALVSHDPDLLAKAEELSTPDERRLASTLLGRWDEAVLLHDPPHTAQPLERMAAFYMRGRTTRSLTDFGRALQSLRDAPPSALATFNRALILEQLSDREEAAATWEQYLAEDSSSPWADEARRHLRDLRLPSPAERWVTDKPLLIAAATAGHTAQVRELAARYPLGARRVVELELLPAWGEALTRGQSDIAARTLAAAQSITACRPVKEERLLESAIREITIHAQTAGALASAYRAYGAGMRAFDSGELDTALASFAEALDLAAPYSPAFEAIVGPAVITTYYRRYDHAEAEALIERTRMKYGHQFDQFITLAARLDWLDGLIRIARGDPSGAIRSYQRALLRYERLREAEYEAAQHVNQADSYTYLGDDARTGIHLSEAMARASRAEDPKRLHGILAVAADFLLDTAGPEPAVTLQNRLVRLARSTGDPLRVADALVSRSTTLVRAGRRTEALRDLADAVVLMPRITDEPTRQRLRADASVAEAFAYRDQDDTRVVVSLSAAIDRFRALNMRPFAAQLLLERGRAYTRLQNHAAAERDFRAGTEELESQRGAVDDADLRITYLDRADRVFVDLAELLVRRGKVEEAFDFLERSRARELLDRTLGGVAQPVGVRSICAVLPDDTVVVTHTLTKTTLLTFVATHRGVRANEQHVDARSVELLVSEIRGAFASGRPVPGKALRELGRLLVDGAKLPRARRVIFIPDRALHSVPFAALRTAAGRYLVEDHAIAVAPSATLIVQPSASAARASGSPAVLAVASADQRADFPALAPLPHARQEARRVAAHYPSGRFILASDSTASSLLALTRAYNVLHFAGHSAFDARAPRRSALLLGLAGKLTVADIEAADLSHLRLVVLGGCNTNIGKSHRSEGVMSLARAFLVASVPEVMATIAPIDDADAKRLLDEFHGVYSRGGDAAEALREAQLQMLHSGHARSVDPAAWAPFHVVVGRAANR